MVRRGLDTSLEDIVALSKTRPTIVFELVEWAERREKVITLLEAARDANPENAQLMALGGELGLASVAPPSSVLERVGRGEDVSSEMAAWHTNLERHVRDETKFQDTSSWLARWGALERQVCRMEVYGFSETEYGTGFLVGPDLVLTNHHVVEMLFDEAEPLSPKRVTCRFDYRRLADGQTLNNGREFRLDASGEWCLAKSPISASDELIDGGLPDAGSFDYALLRLSEKAGELPVDGEADSGAAKRGWIDVGTPPELDANHIVHLLQHPSSEPLKVASGRVLAVNSNGTRLRHDSNTEGGSSGSPCFTADLGLAALHHVGDPDKDRRAEFNQAVPMTQIVAHLQSLNITL